MNEINPDEAEVLISLIIRGEPVRNWRYNLEDITWFAKDDYYTVLTKDGTRVIIHPSSEGPENVSEPHTADLTGE